MAAWLEWVNQHMVDIVFSSGLAVTLATALAVWLISAGRSWIRRPNIVQIKRAYDPRIERIEKIQDTFPPDERDPPGILSGRIASSRFNIFGRPQSDEWMILLCYQAHGKIIGYLSAVYFVKTQTIFFWYLVNTGGDDVSAAPKDAAKDLPHGLNTNKVAVGLIKRLLQACSGRRPWLHMVAEVDAIPGNLGPSRNKVRRFQQYAAKLNEELGGKGGSDEPRVFKINVPYSMPCHDNDNLAFAKSHESPGWLIYAPKFPDRFRIGGMFCISKSDVSRLLYSLLVLGYHDDEDDEYNDYILDSYNSHCIDLPEMIDLVWDRKRM